MRLMYKLLIGLTCLSLIAILFVLYDRKRVIIDFGRIRSLMLRQYNSSIYFTSKYFPAAYQQYFSSNEHVLTNSKLTPKQVAQTLEPLGNKLSRKERRLVFEMLQEIRSKFDKYRVSYYIDSGTLLGSYRHHGLIPWDDDVDVSASINQRKFVQSLWPHHEQYIKNKNKSSKFIIYSQSRIDKLYHVEGRNPNQYPWKFPFIDIFYFRQNSTHVHRLLGPDGSQYHVALKYVMPTHLRPLGIGHVYNNLSMSAPKDALATIRAAFKTKSACKCSYGGYSHMIEGGISSDSVSCQKLARQLPFVKRSALSEKERRAANKPVGIGIKETLMIGSYMVHEKVVDEPVYALSKMFCFEV